MLKNKEFYIEKFEELEADFFKEDQNEWTNKLDHDEAKLWIKKVELFTNFTEWNSDHSKLPFGEK
jgi:hypothetical protein